MNQKAMKSNQERITLESIYPNLSPAEIARVEATLERYIQLILRMHARLTQSKNETYAHPRTLTEN